MEPTSILEDIPRQVSTARIENEKQVGNKTESARVVDMEQSDQPAPKLGALLNVQFADELGQCKKKSPSHAEDTRGPPSEDTSQDESPGGR